MDCRKIVDLLPDYSVDSLDRRTRQDVADHLVSCADCKKEMSALDQAMALVEAHGALAPPDGLWNGVYNRLTAEDLTSITAPSWWTAVTSSWRRPATGMALGAAAVACAVALYFPRLDGGAPPAVVLVPDHEVAALVRQHAMTTAESPLGDRVAWEVQLRPARGVVGGL